MLRRNLHTILKRVQDGGYWLFAGVDCTLGLTSQMSKVLEPMHNHSDPSRNSCISSFVRTLYALDKSQLINGPPEVC